MTKEEGNPIPFSTLGRIEQGQLDPGMRRLQRLLRLYHLPIQAAGDLLDLDDLLDELPSERDPTKLYKEGLAAWQKGDLRKAIAHFVALRQSADEGKLEMRQRATLAFAVAAGSLGKHHLSLLLLDDLLVQPIDKALLVPVLVQAARAWHGLNGFEAAHAFLARARVHLAKGAHLQRAWIEHEAASIAIDERDFAGSDRAIAIALRAYRAAGDQFNYGRALGTQLRSQFEREKPVGVLRMAKVARFHAKRHGLKRNELQRTIDEGRAYLLQRDPKRAVALLTHALADAIRLGDPAGRFSAHYYLWEAHRMAGNEREASRAFDAAAQDLAYVDQVSKETIRMREILRDRGSRMRR